MSRARDRRRPGSCSFGGQHAACIGCGERDKPTHTLYSFHFNMVVGRRLHALCFRINSFDDDRALASRPSRSELRVIRRFHIDSL